MKQTSDIITRSFFILFLMLTLGTQALSQSLQVKRANTFYKAGAYSRAIPLYEKAIEDNEGNYQVKSRLSHCYRILNKWEKAVMLLAELAISEKAKPSDLYNYAEALLSTGQYAGAKVWANKYLAHNPDDEKGRLLLIACDKVREIVPVFEHVTVQPFLYNSDVDENAPVMCGDKLVFSSDRKQGFNILKQRAGQTGRDFLKLYSCTLSNDFIFSEPAPFSKRLNALNKNTSNASFTADGSIVVFSRNCDELSRSGVFNLQLYSAQADGDGWKDVQVLPFCTPEFNFMHPYVSPDGTELFFVSDRGNGSGGTDIYRSLKKGDTWTRPENLGDLINTGANEGFPFMDAEGNLYFCSKGHPGYGGFDIFRSMRTIEGEFGRPVNLGMPINSISDDICLYLNEDLVTGMFTSSREGKGDDIFFFLAFDTDEDLQDYLLNTNEKHAESAPRLPKEYGTDVLTARGPSAKLKEEEVPYLSPDAVNNHLDSINMLASADINDLKWMLQYKQSVESRTFTIPGIIYLNGQITVTPSIAVELDKIADLLTKYSTLITEVGVHTESIGDDALNMQYSQQRAEIIVEYFVFKGISPLRLEYHGYGETKPLNHCSNGIECNPEDHLLNHRVELKILKE